MEKSARMDEIQPGPQSRDQTYSTTFSILASVWLVLAVILTVQASRVDTFSGDLHFTAWVQMVSAPGVDAFVSFLNWLGRPIPLLILMAIICIWVAYARRYHEIVLLASTSFVHVVNALLKSAAASPRPTGDVVRVSDQAAGFGFPSGHTMAVVVFCGVCVYLAWRLTERPALKLAAGAAALVLVLGMGFSRIHAGAHWPTDVLGAYLWGAFYVLALIVMYRRLLSRIEDSVPLRS
jgi:undecaprenyl-diphosphatase